MRSTLKEKDSYINKLESENQTQTRELAYLTATNADLNDRVDVSPLYSWGCLGEMCVRILSKRDDAQSK